MRPMHALVDSTDDIGLIQPRNTRHVVGCRHSAANKRLVQTLYSRDAGELAMDVVVMAEELAMASIGGVAMAGMGAMGCG